MANLNGFNAEEVAPSTGFDPIPAGKYKAIISESEMKDTKSGTGQYLQLTFVVVEGEYENRKLWARLNLDNPNDQAVGIARAELSAICRAVGVLKPKDSGELHEIPLTIKVVTRLNKQSGELTNEIKGYEPATAGAVPSMAPATASATPPWKKRG